MSLGEFSRVPVIDVAPLVNHTAERAEAAAQIGTACRECGFFYIAEHGVDDSLCRQLEGLSRRFSTIAAERAAAARANPFIHPEAIRIGVIVLFPLAP